jgi:hypothetical protein
MGRLPRESSSATNSSSFRFPKSSGLNSMATPLRCPLPSVASTRVRQSDPGQKARVSVTMGAIPPQAAKAASISLLLSIVAGVPPVSW